MYSKKKSLSCLTISWYASMSFTAGSATYQIQKFSEQFKNKKWTNKIENILLKWNLQRKSGKCFSPNSVLSSEDMAFPKAQRAYRNTKVLSNVPNTYIGIILSPLSSATSGDSLVEMLSWEVKRTFQKYNSLYVLWGYYVYILDWCTLQWSSNTQHLVVVFQSTHTE